ncbi:MAG: NAD(P)H-dependent oxidoreductase [Pseudomonadota bacterium]|nr:NAD(P)H-dependent oxidoreductase [Pseudomonadota bacterium]
MSTLLKINTSILASGNSRQLVDHFVSEWQRTHPKGKIIDRDLASVPIPHIDENVINGFFTPAEEQSINQRKAVTRSDELIKEIVDSDTIVLGVPMYNFGIPSTLKAWIDHVARAGITFNYSPNGPIGLLAGRKAFILSAQGGKFAGSEHDSLSGQIRSFFWLVGISDITFVYAQGMNIANEKDESTHTAKREISRLVA